MNLNTAMNIFIHKDQHHLDDVISLALQGGEEKKIKATQTG